MKTLQDYINESILDDDDVLIQDTKNSVEWFNVIKQQLIKFQEGNGGYRNYDEVIDYIKNNEIINSTLKPVFKKFDHFIWWIKLYRDDHFASIQLSDSKRGDWTLLEKVIRFEYAPNKYFRIKFQKPQDLTQSTANKMKINKYVELIEETKNIAKKDLSLPICDYYLFEI